MGNVQQLHEISELCSTLFSSRSHSVNNMYIQSLEYHHMIDILDKVYASPRELCTFTHELDLLTPLSF